MMIVPTRGRSIDVVQRHPCLLRKSALGECYTTHLSTAACTAAAELWAESIEGGKVQVDGCGLEGYSQPACKSSAWIATIAVPYRDPMANDQPSFSIASEPKSGTITRAFAECSTLRVQGERLAYYVNFKQKNPEFRHSGPRV